MYAKGITRDELLSIAAELGFGIEATDVSGPRTPERVRFTLKPGQEFPLVRRKFNPNPDTIEWSGLGNPLASNWRWCKANAICFHGHWDFIDRVFKLRPDAEVRSSRYGKIVYNAENFTSEAANLGEQRLGHPGNIYHEFKVRDCCQCEHELHPVAGR